MLKNLVVFTLLTLQMSVWSMTDMSSLQKVLKKASDRDSTSSEMSPLQLYVSPLQPGGSYGLQINWSNVLRGISPKLAKKIDRGVSLIDQYAAVLTESDDELVKFRNDDRPWIKKEHGGRSWKDVYKEMYKAKYAENKTRVIRMAING